MKNTILLLLSVLLLSCSNSQLEISIANEEDIVLGKKINLSLINNSKNDYAFFLNNSDTLNISDDYSIFYKIFDRHFNEIEKIDISILEGEFLISDQYKFLTQKRQDSLTNYKKLIVKSKDTLTQSFNLKCRFYDTPLSYQYYEVNKNEKYYIAFFVQNVRILPDQTNDDLLPQTLQSKYYRLKH